MSEAPWPLDADDEAGGATLNYVDRSYCATGETGTYSSSQLRERIREQRIKRLPDRIQALIDDIALIGYADDEFLTTAEWKDIQEAILDVDSRMGIVMPGSITYGRTTFDTEFNFGFEIGCVLRWLFADIEADAASLLWGLMVGYRGLPADQANGEAGIMDRILDEIEDLKADRYNTAEAILESRGFRQAIRTDRADDLAAAFQTNGIDIPISEISLIKAYVSAHIYLHGGVEPYVFDDPRGAASELNREQLSVVVRQLRDCGLLYEIEQLCADIKADIEQLTAGMSVISGVQTADVVEKVYRRLVEADETAVSAKALSPGPNKDDLVKGVLHRLSANHKGHLHTESSIVTEHDSRWQFTDYGECVARTLCTERSPGWVYEYAFDALRQVVGVHNELLLTDRQRAAIGAVVDEAVCWTYLRKQAGTE